MENRAGSGTEYGFLYDLQSYQKYCGNADCHAVSAGTSGTEGGTPDRNGRGSGTYEDGCNQTVEYGIAERQWTGSDCDGWTFRRKIYGYGAPASSGSEYVGRRVFHKYSRDLQKRWKIVCSTDRFSALCSAGSGWFLPGNQFCVCYRSVDSETYK